MCLSNQQIQNIVFKSVFIGLTNTFWSNDFVKLVQILFILKHKENGDEIKNHLIEITKQTTVPNVFVNGQHVGGFDATSKANADGRLKKLLGGSGKKKFICGR